MCQKDKILPDIVIGDEARFYIDGTINTYNVRMHAPKGGKPDFTFQRNNSRHKVTVWDGMFGNGILSGPYFLTEILMSETTSKC